MPFGHFESSPDGIDNTTQIPSIFTFQTHPYLADGQFAVGPFAGLSAVNNAVHSSEINLLAAAQLSQKTLGIDSEVYIGTFLLLFVSSKQPSKAIASATVSLGC